MSGWSNNLDVLLRPADSGSHDRSQVIFAKTLTVLLIVGPILMAGILLAAGHPERLMGTIPFALVGVAGFYLLRKGWVQLAFQVLVYGIWVCAGNGLLWTHGLTGTTLGVVILSLAFAGWLAGPASAIILTAATPPVFYLLAYLEVSGWPISAGATVTPYQRAFVYSITALGGGALGYFGASSLRERLNRLQQSEKKYASVFSTVPDAIVVTRRRDATYLELNPASEKMLGYSSGNVTGRNSLELGIWANQSDRTELLSRLDRDGAVDKFPSQFVHADGRIIDVLVSAVPLDISGEQCILWSWNDMTSMRAAERALARESHRNAVYLRNASDGVHILDANGNVLEVSDSFCKMLGYSRDEMLAANVSLWDAHLSPKELELIIADQLAKAAYSVFETRHRRRDGSVFDVEVSGHPLELDGKRVLFNSARDITERKRVDAALRASEEKFATAFRSSPMFVAISTVADGRYIDVNEAALRVMGYAREEIIGRTAGEIRLWKSPEDRQRAVELLLRDGRIAAFEAELRKKSGDIMVGEIWGEPIQVDGQRCIFWITNDITARKAAEAEHALLQTRLRESQKMEALGTLAGGVAHDFNNIVASIIGNLTLARQDASRNPAALESLEEIDKAARRARDLVQQILSFSRRQPTERRLITLAPILDDSVRLLRATLPARVELEAHCAAEVPRVLADATQIEQVVINLANNAAQATHGRPGHIGIHIDAVTVGEAQTEVQPAVRNMRAGGLVRLRVSDDGCGMETATLERIFEPFFTTKPKGEGTGLGLSVVHGIVTAHEGVITVKSEPGKGTNVTVYLPVPSTSSIAPEGEAYAARTDRILGTGGGRRILYLDDDEALVSLVKRLLERRGFRVSAHTDQREALDALRADSAELDLVVTDYNMPGMSGLDIAREVRAIRPDLPVAVASGFIDEELRAQAAGAGVRELIFKADSAEDMCEAFARLAQTLGVKSRSS